MLLEINKFFDELVKKNIRLDAALKLIVKNEAKEYYEGRRTEKEFKVKLKSFDVSYQIVDLLWEKITQFENLKE